MMIRRTAFLALATAFLAALCTDKSVGAEPGLDDAEITLAVTRELLLQDSLPVHNIDVASEEGIVTLTGSVASYGAKLRAESVSEGVKGVIEVRNEIEVRPALRTDEEIRADVLAALAADPAAEPYEIAVKVEEGFVTLKGRVDSFTERQLAEKVAKVVRGVKHVTNVLRFDYQPDRPDREIRGDVEGRLRWSASINSGLVDVSVDDGEVTLDGAVASALEKSLAESEAQAVAGVKSVKNELAVKWWLVDEMGDHGQDWSDRNMRQAIKKRLLYNPRVKSFNVVVDVKHGIATLTGSVDNLRAKRAAKRTAAGTSGVWKVNNYIRVRPPETTPDADVAADVRKALHRSPYVDRYDIQIQVRNGLVYLKGEVDSHFMRERAEEIASSVPGVIDLHSYLDVDSEYAEKSDREIKEDVESQLWWSPFVDSDDITVEVYGGVATLRGTVSDWSEYLSAKENALEGGATSVICDLEVDTDSEG